jgi:hypothetical protein
MGRNRREEMMAEAEKDAIFIERWRYLRSLAGELRSATAAASLAAAHADFRAQARMLTIALKVSKRIALAYGVLVYGDRRTKSVREAAAAEASARELIEQTRTARGSAGAEGPAS